MPNARILCTALAVLLLALAEDASALRLDYRPKDGPAQATDVAMPVDRDAVKAAPYETKLPLRTFVYGYLGVGAANGRMSQGGTSGTDTGLAYAVGLDRDGMFGIGNSTVELSYRGGIKPVNFGDFTCIGYYMLSFGGDRVGERKPFRIGIGTGAAGYSVTQAGGTQTSSAQGDLRNNTFASVIGIPAAVKAAWYGERTMVRVGAYYVFDLVSKTGMINGDGSNFFGLNTEGAKTEADTSGNLFAARVDVVHKFAERAAADRMLSGVGLTLLYQRGRVKEATVQDFIGNTQTNVTLPEATFQSVQLLLTFGYLR